MLVCYRDDGFWILTWYRFYRRLIGGLTSELPGPGFVGQASFLFLATERKRCRLKSTRMRRSHFTDGVQHWRLTCVWVL